MNIHLFTQDNTPYTINHKQFVGGNRINWFLNEYHMFLCTSYEQFTCTKTSEEKKTLEMQKE